MFVSPSRRPLGRLSWKPIVPSSLASYPAFLAKVEGVVAYVSRH